MKRIILLLIFFIGIIPCMKNGAITIQLGSQVLAQAHEDDSNGWDRNEVTDDDFDDFMNDMAGEGYSFGDPSQPGTQYDLPGHGSIVGEGTTIFDSNGNPFGMYISPDNNDNPEFPAGSSYFVQFGAPPSTGGGDEGGGGGGGGGGIPPDLSGDGSTTGGGGPADPPDDGNQTTYGSGFVVQPPIAFRFLKLNTIAAELNARIQDPTKIDQSGTGLCGIACIAKTFAQYDAVHYMMMTNELAMNGKAVYSKTNFSVNVLGADILNADPSDSTWPISGSKMPQADFVLLASIRSQLNRIPYNYGPAWYQQFTGINTPGDIENLMTNFLGLQFVANNTSTNALSFTQYTRQDLEREVTAQASGYSPRIVYMLIDADMINNPNGSNNTLYPDHWVELLPNTYSYDATTSIVTFKVFTWGGTRTVTIGEANFNKYFYGTVAGNR